MSHALPLTWFQERVTQTIYRDGRPVKIVNEAAAPYLHSIQKDGYKFTDEPVAKGPKVHQGPPDSLCIACE